MKAQKLLIALFLLPTIIFSQKHDFNWHVESPYWGNNYETIILNFDKKIEDYEVKQLGDNFFQFYSNIVTMSDSLGDFLFTFNGNRVYDKNYNLMANGDSLTLNYNYSPTGGTNVWTPVYFALPWPNSSSEYILIQQKHKIVTLPNGTLTGYGESTLYSKIDMNKNNGLGEVVEKNKVFIERNHLVKTAACKHANGRDWWLLTMDVLLAKYDISLLTPEGVFHIEERSFPSSISLPLEIEFWNPIYTSFSPDGSKFLFSLEHSGIYVFDFDRCSGALGDYLRLEQDLWFTPDWAMFSPNGRYIYSIGSMLQGGNLPIIGKYYQFDLEASDPQASLQVIGENDDFKHPMVSVQQWAGQLFPAPNGKIYGRSNLNFLHEISFPNRKGLGSKFKLRNLAFPIVHLSQSSYYHPNYRLGPIDGSACDTLGLNNHPFAHFRWDIEDTLSPYTVTFTDVSAYEPETWAWDFDGLGISNDTNPVFTFPGPGFYEVCMEVCNLNSCDTLCKTIELGAKEPFKTSFLYKIDADERIQFEDLSQQNPVSWEWDFGDGNSSSEQHPDHRYAFAGQYVTCLKSCNDTGECDSLCLGTYSLTNSSIEVVKNKYIKLFPNPTSDYLQIELENIPQADLLEIYNQVGQLVYSKKVQNPNNIEVPTKGFADGVYHLNIRGREVVASEVFVVQH